MHDAPRYEAFEASASFADNRASRVAPTGTVPRGWLREDEALYTGKVAGQLIDQFPLAIAREELARGQQRFNIYCTPCHGTLGDGNGITKSYGMVATPTYHDDRLRGMAEGEIYNTITHGKNTMFAYADKLSPDERWAVVAYVRALQRAAHATIDDVPLEQRGGLK